MPKADICFEMVFTDMPYEKRIEEIARIGYDAIEFWHMDRTFNGTECTTDLPKDASVLKQVCEANGVKICGMSVNAPDGIPGGELNNPADLGKYLDKVHEVIEFAGKIGCKQAITCSGNFKEGVSRADQRKSIENMLSKAAEIAAKADFTLMLEPLNIHVDHAGYYLDSTEEAAQIVRSVGSPNLKLLYDIYHMQIMDGNIIDTIKKNIDIIGHFHAAGVPGRHELFIGELNYVEIGKAIDALGYKGCVGLEYAPALADHRESLKAQKDIFKG